MLCTKEKWMKSNKKPATVNRRFKGRLESDLRSTHVFIITLIVLFKVFILPNPFTLNAMLLF